MKPINRRTSSPKPIGFVTAYRKWGRRSLTRFTSLYSWTLCPRNSSSSESDTTRTIISMLSHRKRPPSPKASTRRTGNLPFLDAVWQGQPHAGTASSCCKECGHCRTGGNQSKKRQWTKGKNSNGDRQPKWCSFRNTTTHSNAESHKQKQLRGLAANLALLNPSSNSFNNVGSAPPVSLSRPCLRSATLRGGTLVDVDVLYAALLVASLCYWFRSSRWPRYYPQTTPWPPFALSLIHI